jgi:hypothetical protein
LRSGFSTGAFARWRTLHEIWVVFALLSEGDEELAHRYLARDAVESAKGQREYEETWQALGFDPPDWTSQQRDELRSSLRQEYGASFLEGYGWAAPLFGGRAPTFRQSQKLAKLDHWRGYYRMASHGTHANPKGIRWNIQAGAKRERSGPVRPTQACSGTTAPTDPRHVHHRAISSFCGCIFSHSAEVLCIAEMNFGLSITAGELTLGLVESDRCVMLALIRE